MVIEKNMKLRVTAILLFSHPLKSASAQLGGNNARHLFKSVQHLEFLINNISINMSD